MPNDADTPDPDAPTQTPGASPTPTDGVPKGPSSETTAADVPGTDANNPVDETKTASDSGGTESGQTAPLTESANVDSDAAAGSADIQVDAPQGELAAADQAAEPAGEEPTTGAEVGAASPDEMGPDATGESYAVDMGLTLGGGRAPEDIAPPPESMIRGSIDRFGTAMGTGRRKTSVARVRISDGTGQFSVNGRDLEDYFSFVRDVEAVRAPLERTEMSDNVDVWVRVEGGGTTGQAGAIVLGIARALQAKDPNLHGTLHHGGFLTRDERAVERKKYGRRKARRSFQFSKR
ncbi:30S ribosomal protein S9 [Alienimonas sp. DA493]|uniref:30S ribosomal protein S9 n=1 Tax=Alienimonas sp. DA493 TaxID=3373605 RepID=UPI003754A692